MKNLYFKSITRNLKFLALMTGFLFGTAITAEAQVRVGFTQRTSQYSPNTKIYNVKGDFTMLGNTCLTPQNYGDNTNNNGQFMTYVDTDNDATTFNSSSSTLVLSTENGAIPSCSNIVYAGLYWTGKSSGSNTFNATRTIANTTVSVNTTSIFSDEQVITDTRYDLNVSRGGSTGNRYPVYTFSGNGNNYVFTFFNSGATNRVTVSVNGGTATNVPVSVNGAQTEATLNTAYVITDGSAQIRILKLIRLAGNNESTTNTENNSTAQVNISGITPFLTVTKTYDKRNIKLKGPASSSYTEFTAAAGDIYYPTGGTDDDIFSGYKEITDYVRTNGIGQYWAADLPLLEGNVGGTGYSGGWGIIVVYENTKMKWRDVTIFDGYAYVQASNGTAQNLPVSGFNTVQSGNVGLKLGVMASEGDVNFTGDYFRVLKNSDNTYLTLNHSGNATDNFFNSSINAGGTRNPNLPNNTGIDIAMFNVPNAGNAVIGNNQTSTNFRYGTDGDTYSIFAIAMSVDAYIPEVEGILTATTINNVPAVQPYTTLPGQEIGFSVDIKNLGTEAINGYKVIIPIPFNATYVPGSAVGTVFFTPLPTPNTVTFDPSLGATGSIVWNMGTLPLPASPSTLLGRLTFKLKATTDCQILANASCGGAINVNGAQSGTGATTGIVFPGTKLIQGYTQNGVCTGSAIAADLSININGATFVTQNCQNVPIVRNFSYCNSNSTVAVSEIASNFPAGSLFYDSFPVTMASVQFTASNPFPLIAGNTTTFYAVPPTGGSGCNYPFTITKCRPIIANDDTYSSVSCTSAAIVGNIYSNDTLGGTPFTPGQVTFTLLTGANPNITIATNGNITVTPGIPAGVYTLTYKICEGTSLTNCDNATIRITVTDTTPPVITNIPSGTTTISCPATPVFAQATATDACGSVNLTFVDVRTNGLCAGSYTVVRTWTATDLAGNVTTGAQTIIVTDTTAPVIAALPGVSTINCPATPVFAQATATDACGSVFTLTSNDVRTNGLCAGSYSITRTWTATDTCGNVSTASQTINVVDNAAPVIAALPAPSTISCTGTPTFAVATATDACGSLFTLTSADTTTPGACAGSRTITRTWTATDACGNTATAAQVITVQDTTAPVIAALPAPSTISCPATPVFAVATATDACGSTFTLTSADATTPGACTGSYSVTRTWTATDACGNTSTASQTINVQDTTAPVIAQLPAPSSISCPAEPVFAVATATDACNSTFTLTSADTTVPGACAGSRVVTRTWTATDSCGNVSTASQTITVTDTTAPVIAQLPAPSTISCPATPVFAVATATDACNSTFTLTSADVTTPGQCAGSYSVTRTWTATDSCGNVSTASQTINVQDTTAPVIAQLPAPTTISCPATPVFAVATATDACNSTFTLTSADVTTQGTCAGAYSVTRTWTATDACGNVSTASQTINVEDNQGPVIVQLPAPTTISCTETPVFAVATATDACNSSFTLTSADATTPGTCAGAYSITRTWTATDACGNVSTASQTINVQDTTAPVIAQLPAPSTISCPATPEFAVATATDACGSAFTLTSADTTAPGTCAGSYAVTRTWTATDACGNVSTASQTINVQDNSAPVIAQLPAPSTISCPATPEFAVATATDACGSAFTLTSADATTPGQCAGSYSVTRTWTATDACGNVSTASQTINVQDTTAPVIAQLPAPTTISCPATPVFAVATATDACNSTFTLTSADVTTQGTCAGAYSVTRTWTATDACGNVSTASQTINVEDTTAPVIAQLPAPTTISCTETPVFAVATATDACNSSFTLTSADATTPGTCAGAYSITRTWTATDACGNVSTASQTINVQDTTAPVIAQLPAPSTISCPATPEFAVATATDACGSAFTLTSADTTAPGTCAGSYAVTRTWTATDACGNVSTASQTINVQDNSAPVIAQLPAPTTISCPAMPEFAVATATDACGSAFTLTSADTRTSGQCAGSYSVTRTWTATDACGNTSTASQTINVEDTTAPVIAQLPAPTTINCPATPEFAVATATDACDSAFTLTSTDSTSPGTCAGTYSVTRTWTATDACGNISTASQTINVQDVTAPVIAELPATSTIACPNTPVFAQATAVDACGSTFTLTSADATTPGQCAGSYSVTRTWTATDSCGNVSTASQTINVEDTVAPVIVPLPATSTIACPDTPVFAQAIAVDECGSVFTLTSDDVTTPGQCAGSYSVTRTWTATDACGNASTATQTINVEDTSAPVIAALPQPTTISCPATPEFAVATAVDACSSAFTLTSNDVTNPGTCAGTYAVTRTWTATDACGNVSTASQTINVQDNTPPTITADANNITVECDGTGSQGAITAWLNINGGATATDLCSDVTWTNNFNALGNDCSAAVTVIFTARDACGNTATTSATFTVQDVTAPVAPEAPADITVTCGDLIPAAPQLSATDLCAGIITATGIDATTPGTCANSYVVTRTWTFIDACANTSSVSQTITVNDDIAPVIAQLPAPSTISCPATPEFAQATATDNCTGVIVLTSEDVTTAGQCAGSYSVTRTWTAIDACGNTSTASQTINVEDTTAPTIAELPVASTISCPATPEFAVATATDACNSAFELTFADATTNGQCAGSYSVTRTWTATDACGNTSTATQTINVEDTTAPVIAELPIATTISCPATPEFAVATATDACGSAFTLTSADTTNPGTCAGSYAVTRTWTATDACGNVSTASQTITVLDDTAPVIAELPAPTTIDCPATPVFAEATATDACGSAFTLTSNDVTTQGTCAGSYSVTRTWTATDTCGNISTATQTINVQDVTAPEITTQASNITVECDGTGSQNALNEWLANNGGAVATDACSDVTWTNDFNALGNDCSAAVTVIFTATDACGNATTTSATFTVQDVTAPTAPEAPADVTVSCADEVPAAIQLTATDLCAGIITATGVDAIAEGACPNAYVITRTWTFTDACNNSSTAVQTITVNDVTAPVAPEAPAAITVACADEVPAMVSLTATDNCNDQITAEGVDAIVAGACANSFVITRTWTFTDACNNTSTVSQVITVNDTVAPVAPEAPADVTVACADEVPAMVSLTATDNCNDQITAEGVDAILAGACANSFVITRTWTFTDDCNNTSTVSQVITVNDTEAPVAPEAPAAITVACADEVPAMVSLTATDNCNDQITAEGVDAIVAGACANSFVITRTWTFTDACNNTSTVSQLITVNDTEAPVAPEVPADVTVACADEVPAMISLTATDNCNDQITAEGVDAIVAGACANSYVITRTWTFTDACNNTSTVSQVITVNDTEAPVAPEVPADLTVACADEVPPMVSLTATDNCNDQITANGVDAIVAGACANSFVITRTWTFTDACNNTSTVSQVITVSDTEAPVIAALPATSTIGCGQTPDFAVATATDNCNGAFTLTSADTTVNGACAGSYAVTRTWTATDLCGNVSTASQTINVEDTTAPVISGLPGDSTIECPATPQFDQAVATDACGSAVTLTFVDVNTPGNNSSYTVVRTWTATDACGNASTATQMITVRDTQAPVAPVLADVVGQCSATVPVPTAQDLCAGTVTGTTADPLTYSTQGTFIVQWTFSDGNGNSFTANQTVIIDDTTNPDIPVLADVTGQCAVTVPAPSTTDSCVGGGIVGTTTDPTFYNVPGTYVVNWTFDDGNGNVIVVPQNAIVTPNSGPTPLSSTDADCNNDLDKTFDLNAYLPAGTPSGTWSTIDAEVIANSALNGSVFKPLNISVGGHLFTYTITNAGGCDQIFELTMIVDDNCPIDPACSDLLVHNAISTNNDGINENFVIEQIDQFICYPTNSVEIYNRWGVLVFETQQYDNATRVFTGRSEGRATIGAGQELPTGTYFYIIKYFDARTGRNVNAELQGYLYLTR